MQSIKKTKSFKIVYNSGRYKVNDCFAVHFLKNGSESTRLGISVSKKVGNAVVRNKVRRLIKECCRLGFDDIAKGIDIVIVARVGVNKLLEKEAFSNVDKSLRSLFKRLGLLNG